MRRILKIFSVTMTPPNAFVPPMQSFTQSAPFLAQSNLFIIKPGTSRSFTFQNSFTPTTASLSFRKDIRKKNEGFCSFSMNTVTPDQGPVGFIGLGIMGLPMALNILKKTDYDLVVWNRSRERCELLQTSAPSTSRVSVVDTPKDVTKACKRTFVMLSTPEAVSSVLLEDENAAVNGLSDVSCIIDCSTISENDSHRTAHECKKRGATYLEAPVSGSKGPAISGDLIFLCGGNEDIFKHIAELELKAMGKASFYLGDVGMGARMKMVVNQVMGTMMAGFAEGMVLNEKIGGDNHKLLEILSLGAMANPMFKLKGPKMLKDTKDYDVAFPLEHMQKDMRFSLMMGDDLGIQMPCAAAANELYKLSKGEGYARDDFSAIIEALRREKK